MKRDALSPDPDRLKELAYGKDKEKSQYAEMTKEQKHQMMLRRLKDDEQRAKQQLSTMKKKDTKKRPFVSKKSPYIFSTGYAICASKAPDHESYYFGLSTGAVVLYDYPKGNHTKTVIKNDSPILDLLPLSNSRLIIVDDFCTVKVFDDNKLVKILPEKCLFVGGSYNYSKILVGTENYLFYVNEAGNRVTKVDLRDFSTDYISLGRDKIFQLALVDNKLYGVTEDGYLVKATMGDLHTEAHDEEDEGSPSDVFESRQVFIERLTNEQMGLGMKSHANDMLESSIIIDTERSKLDNTSMEELDESPQLKSKSQQSYERMTQVLNLPVKPMFFRTITASSDYVSVVAHDGQGHNIIYLYSSNLELKAFKYIRIDEHDFSFNLNKYIHKLHIEKRKEGSYLFAITHRKEYKMYVYKINDNEITMMTRFKHIHSGLITDLRLQNDVITTTGRDKKVRFYPLDFKYDTLS
jgi:hypothetical protein